MPRDPGRPPASEDDPVKLLQRQKFPAPDFSPLDWAGDPLSVGSLREKVVLVDFFSLGDPVGVRDFGPLADLGERYGEAGLVVVGVHVPAYDFERDPATVRRALWEAGVHWPVALDQSFETFRAWRAGDLPARALLDGTGCFRGWQRDPAEIAELEPAIRWLLRENQAEVALPTASPGLRAPQWYPTPELRFGARGVSWEPEGDESAAAPEGSAAPASAPGPSPSAASEGTRRTFASLPDLRAEGRPYLLGEWSRSEDRLTLESDEGSLAIVYEARGVYAVAARRDDGAADNELRLRIDGEAPGAATAGRDVELDEAEGRARVRIDHGGVHHLVQNESFGLHHLEIEIRGRGTELFGLEFATENVPAVD